MINPKVFARLAEKYFEENNLCPKCHGSLNSCHEKEEDKNA